MMAQLPDMYRSTGGAVLRKRAVQYNRNVILLKNCDFRRIDGHVCMPTDSEISTLRKTQPGQFRKKVEFSASMSEDAAKKKLQETFPYLENTSFVCAAVVKVDKEHKKLEFYGPPRVWNGKTIRKTITGNSALYILENEVPDSVTELNATKMPLGDDDVASNIAVNVNQMSLRDEMENNENHQESSSDESATVQQISYSSGEGTSSIDGASTSGIGAEFSEGDDDVASNIATNVNQMSLRDDSQMEIDENLQESSIDENNTVQHLSQVQMISDSSGVDNLRSYSDTQDFMSGISESGAEPDDWFQSQSWITGFVPLKVESATPDTVPLQGGNLCCFTFNRPLPRDVQSGFATFGPLGTVDVHRCRDDSLVGMKIPPAQEPGLVTVTLKSAKFGIPLGEIKILYVDEEKLLVQRIVNEPRLQCMFLSEMEGQMETACEGEIQDSGNLDFTNPVHVLRLLVYAAAESGAQQFIEMIFNSSAGRIIFDAYKGRPILPEVIAKSHGNEETAFYLEDITKRFSEDTTTGKECSQAIDWSELVKAAEAAEKRLDLTSRKEDEKIEKDIPKETGYLGDIDTSTSESSEAQSSDSDNDSSRMSKKVIPSEVWRYLGGLEAYKKALAEEKTLDKTVPVILIGQDRSGKTSLKRSLIGEPFNPHEESTVGIDVDPSYFKLSTEIWKRSGEVNSETSISYEYHAARATVEHLKEEKTVPSSEGEDVHYVLWDFAGQSVYYTTHPIFLTSRAIYLLAYDLSRNPHEKVKQGMFREQLDRFGLKTYFDYLDFWMSSIASLASPEESDQKSDESEVLTEKLPAVFLVCTHADIPYQTQSDPTTLAKQLFGSLRTQPYKAHLYDVFVVDNTMSECPEVVRLRQEVLAVSKALPQMKESIPIKWLKYEKHLQSMKEGGKKWIDRDAAKTIASEACDIIDDQEFQTVLTFLHDKRILIHFSDTPELDKLVVLDPQWLIDVFKEVITLRPCKLEKKFKALWDKLENHGILEEKLLEHVWTPLLDHKETFESLIAIMEKFSLICSWPSSDALCSKQYLVPSMLKSLPPEGLISLVASARILPLSLKFESGHVPPGLFPRLVLHFLQWDQEGQGKRLLYLNFARFYSSQNEDCSVILLCHSSSIEVVVHQKTSQDLADSLQSKLSCFADASYDTCEVACARAVRRQLGLILESIGNEFCWLKNMKYEVNFICPVCCQEGAHQFCRIHATQGCKLEECLHFWSKSQPCNVKVNRCDKSTAARSNRVNVKQFALGFALQQNQMAVDKNSGGTLANMEESKAIALPIEVQESLLCQTSDAREVVRQLQKTLQPDQASLQEPGLETRQWIRCLARAAKDTNRLDVFEHLREITPAGTCGPWMSEHIDVRNIPVSKIRDLTVDFCGGEEWKMVAEALGLTPREIRFLDRRTLNPLDSALAFIAKQRHITVGELYNVLSECGFPVIADLRL